MTHVLSTWYQNMIEGIDTSRRYDFIDISLPMPRIDLCSPNYKEQELARDELSVSIQVLLHKAIDTLTPSGVMHITTETIDSPLPRIVVPRKTQFKPQFKPPSDGQFIKSTKLWLEVVLGLQDSIERSKRMMDYDILIVPKTCKFINISEQMIQDRLYIVISKTDENIQLDNFRGFFSYTEDIVDKIAISELRPISALLQYVSKGQLDYGGVWGVRHVVTNIMRSYHMFHVGIKHIAVQRPMLLGIKHIAVQRPMLLDIWTNDLEIRLQLNAYSNTALIEACRSMLLISPVAETKINIRKMFESDDKILCAPDVQFSKDVLTDITSVEN